MGKQKIDFDEEDNKESHKRKAKEISGSYQEDSYQYNHEFQNHRKKQRENNIKFKQEDEEDILIFLDHKPEPEPNKNQLKHKPTESKTEALVPTNNRPILFINRLRYYPPDDLLPNMISFRDILFEDLLKNCKKTPFFTAFLLIFPVSKTPKRTLQTAFITTFGYNVELVEPLLKSGVNVRTLLISLNLSE